MASNNDNNADNSLKLPGATTNASTFVSTFATLSSKSSPNGRSERQSSWSAADPNGNSFVSLAEIDTFLLNKLVDSHGEGKGATLHKEYRPCYILAFNMAKDVAPSHSSFGAKTSNDDYITKKEFRLFFVFLILHVQLLDAFAMVDGGGAGVDANDDRRIGQTEFFDASSRSIGSYGFVGLKDAKNSPYEIFKKMDTNAGGVVLLKEWCAYLLEEERRAKTDIGKAVSVDAAVATPKKKDRTGRSGATPSKKTPLRSTTKATPSKSAVASATKNKTATQSHTKKKKKAAATTPSSTQASFRKPGPSSDLHLFLSTFSPLVSLSDPAAKRDRTTQWKNADPNSNGMLSLAEVDCWIKMMLQATHKSLKGNQLYRLYRPSYIVAFDAAKSLAEGSTDDYVTKKEFRLLSAYLCIFAEMLDAFAAIDGGGPGVDSNDDRRISKEEWMKGHHTVSSYDLIKLHKITDTEAETVFNEMDVNGGGYVLLNEWVDYLAKAEVRAETEKGVVLAKTAAYKNVAERAQEDEKKRRDDAAEAEARRVEEEKRAATEKAAAEEAEAAKHVAAAKERAEAERIERKRVADEARMEKEGIAAAKAKAERVKNERIAAEKAEAERIEQERIAAEKAEAARFEVDRLAEEKAEAERVKNERIAAENAEQERIAAEKAEAERIEQERVAAEKAEAARLEAERLAKEKAEAERVEQERVAAEKKAEEERLEQERLEQERIAAEKEEAERVAVGKAEAERIEQERIAAEKAESERLEADRIASEKAEAEELARLEEEERVLAEEEAELARLEEKERVAKEKAEQEEEERIAKALEEKAKLAERLNAELQQEEGAVPDQAAAPASLSSFASSFKAAAPMASSLKAAAGSSLAAAAAKASSLAAAVNKEDEE